MVKKRVIFLGLLIFILSSGFISSYCISAELGVYGPNEGKWYFRDMGGVITNWDINWGYPGSVPVSGDFNLDGREDIGVYGPCNTSYCWYLLDTNRSVIAWDFAHGYPGTYPVVGDFNNDGRDDLGVYGPNEGKWYIKDITGKQIAWNTSWGYANTIPVSGDFNGDGRDDLGVYGPNEGKWYILDARGSLIAWNLSWGYPNTFPVVLKTVNTSYIKGLSCSTSSGLGVCSSEGFCVKNDSSCTPSCNCTIWTNSTWSVCNSSGKQTLSSTRMCAANCGGNCTGIPTSLLYTRSCTPSCTPSCNCTIWTNSTWSVCNSSGKQTLNSTRNCSVVCGGNCIGNSTSLRYTKSCTYLQTPFFASLSQPDVPLTSMSLGDTVLLRFGGENVAGRNVTFKMDIKNGTSWWNIIPGLPRTWNSFLISSGSAFQPYSISNTQAHRINGSIQGEGVWKTSNISSIILTSNNSLPFTVIIYPTKSTSHSNFLKFSVGQLIQFNQSSYDHDDLLNLTWNFGDGNSTSIGGYSALSNSGNLHHSYINGSKFYTATLTAEEMPSRTLGRNSPVSDSVTFYVFGKGINIVPIISSPAYDSLAGYQVMYNASLSYVVNCSDNMPISNFSVGTGTSKLNCTYLLVPKETDPVKGIVRIRWKEVDSNNNLFSWMRGSDSDGVIWNSTNYGIRGNNNSNLNGAVVFPLSYAVKQFRRVRMEMSYDP